MRGKVLIVDDEPAVRDVVGRYLRREGFETIEAADGAQAIPLARDADLVVLDLMLPVIEGLDVCRRLRADRNIPIIMLTAKGEEADTLIGLALGADDYVVKPFSPRELVARIQAVLRRSAATPAADDVIRVGGLRINLATRQVESAGRDVHLTSREFDLLAFLAQRPGQVFTRQQLLDGVWDYTFAGDETTVTVHVRRLREKIEPDPMRPRRIKTVWGVGYKLDP
ncbi:MAG TPA: response regulator transcription factor [Chloroflexota bacterium]|nr:response regulator transcription factor [Chloroflexota bacterium]